MLEARLAKLRQKKMKKSKEDGAEEENKGILWLMCLTFKRKNFSSIDVPTNRTGNMEMSHLVLFSKQAGYPQRYCQEQLFYNQSDKE